MTRGMPLSLKGRAAHVNRPTPSAGPVFGCPADSASHCASHRALLRWLAATVDRRGRRDGHRAFVEHHLSRILAIDRDREP